MSNIRQKSKRINCCYVLGAVSYLWSYLTLLSLIFVGVTLAGSESNESPITFYDVNKCVSEFPAQEDFSTPESAYVAINRVMAGGKQGQWRRISIKEKRNELPAANADRIKVEPDAAKMWLNAHIVEVWIYCDKYAWVIAKTPSDPHFPFDLRRLEFEDGKWLNSGQDGAKTLEAARIHSIRYFPFEAKRPVRTPIDEPESYIKPFIDYLKAQGKEPVSFVLESFKNHQVVIMGEIHHRPLYWAFNSLLVAQPDFPKHIGTIYMELPSNDQALVDEFLSAKKLNPTPIINMLRDNLWMGWPDQPMLDFFTTVWMVNQQLSPEQRLRVVLVDMQRPWKDIHKRSDWYQYDVDREHFMAASILKDIDTHPTEKRNAFFVVGVGHAMLNLKYIENYPMKSAAWHLSQELGVQNVFAIFQHRPVMTNMGRVDGRIHLGLFDYAFAALGNKPVAFSLSQGPFGEQFYDCSSDQPSTCSLYRDGYSAYLFLGALDYEIFSPLIAGFYTNEFVKELDRRYHILYGKYWSKAYQREPNAESFINWMQNSWGKPRKWRNQLEPIYAWQLGDDWERIIREKKYTYALEHPEIIINVARRLFDAIRTADYSKPETVRQLDYTVHSGIDAWAKWVCKTFKENPIVRVELGKVFEGKKKRPVIPYQLTLKGGKHLAGKLPFNYLARQERWQGWTGLDWHHENENAVTK